MAATPFSSAKTKNHPDVNRLLTHDMATKKERHPHAFIATEEDPRKRKRLVPMEVISAGYSRTGTMTMKAALEILGIPTWHWVEMAANPPDMDMWSEALLSKFDPEEAARQSIQPYGKAEFDSLLYRWGATTDQPAAILTEELITAYPEAKVILHERDVERWYESFDRTVIDGSANSWIPLASLLDPVFMKRTCYQTDLIIKYYFNAGVRQKNLVQNDPESFRRYRENARETYKKHNEMVKRVVPKDKLLVFKLADGWEPLCEFLGKDVPDVPFPKVNETKAAQELVKVYIGESYKRAFKSMAKKVVHVLVVFGGVAVWWWRSWYEAES